jgi:NADH-quinone oxidoreductase subunit M
MDAWLLTFVIFFPLVGIFILLFIRPEQKNTIRWVALITAIINFGISLVILARFNTADPNLQLAVKVPWIEVANFVIAYEVGVDGLSILLVLLTTLLTSLAILSSWDAVQENVKNYMIFFLLLEIGMLGVFLSLDLFLFYIFWEFSLVPMYFLIGVWGGPRRIYAAIKFFLYTMAGSILMLLAILFLGIEGHSFSLTTLIFEQNVHLNVPPETQFWLFLAFAVAFAIKVPMWPVHSWLPDAHVEAPTAGSVILAGVLLKMGAYGFLRFNLQLFPHGAVRWAPWFAGLAVIGIIYGAIVSFAQSDMKKLVAYSSISHMGFVVLGIFALNVHGLEGAILQMINHGVSTGALFLLVGVIYERAHTRLMSAFGGLWSVMPLYGTIALVVTLSSMALPGLNGFVGEFTILLGAFDSRILGTPWFAGIGAIGVILAAIYLLQMYQKVFLGPAKEPGEHPLKDLNVREIITLVPLLVLIFWIGLYPRPFFNLMAPTVEQLVATLHAAAGIP